MTDLMYRPGVQAGPDGFAQLLRAEWVKFRTVRGWVVAMIVAVLAIVALGLGPSMTGTCGKNGPASGCAGPVGPGGEQVTDSFYFVHRPLTGNGDITVRVTSLTGQIPTISGTGMRNGLMPWAKAGIIIKASTRQGSAYAAMMVTGRHGVRMQYDYTGDLPGLAGSVSAASPRWLRLTRSGDTLTGYDSANGTRWTRVGTVTLAGLASDRPRWPVRHVPAVRTDVRGLVQRVRRREPGHRRVRSAEPARWLGRRRMDRLRNWRPRRARGQARPGVSARQPAGSP